MGIVKYDEFPFRCSLKLVNPFGVLCAQILLESHKSFLGLLVVQPFVTPPPSVQGFILLMNTSLFTLSF